MCDFWKMDYTSSIFSGIQERTKPLLKSSHCRGTWVAQWVKASAFSSGHDPRVLGSSPQLGSLLSGEAASPPPPPAALPTCDLSPSVK